MVYINRIDNDAVCNRIVYNHFLDYKDYHILKDVFCSDSKDRAPFFYTAGIVSGNELKDDYSFQFTHALYDARWVSDTSPYIDLLDQLCIEYQSTKCRNCISNYEKKNGSLRKNKYKKMRRINNIWSN